MSSARTEVSIVGVGLHPFGRHDPALTGMAMGAHASRLALGDAGVGWADIGYAVGGSNVSGKPDTLVGVLGLTGVPFVNVRNGCATGGVALATAANAIRAGETDLALVVGFDKHARGAFAASPADYGHGDWYAETGLMITTQFFAMKDRRYLHTHGLKERLLAQVAAKAFRCGAANPDAWRRTAHSEEEIMRSRVINPPLTQYMLCSPSEGAAAVVLARSDRAADLCERPVRLAAVAKRTRRFGSFEVFAPWLPPDAGPSPSVDAARARVHRGGHLSRAGAGRAAPGHRRGRRDLPHGRDRPVRARSAAAAAGPERDGADGRLPVNTDGGLLANGEPVGASGLRQVVEVVLQLQGRAGAPAGARPAAGRFHPRLRRAGHQRLHGADGARRGPMSEPDMEAWRATVREWLASVLPRRSERPEGPADYAVFQNITEEAERELLDKVRAYRKQRYDAGVRRDRAARGPGRRRPVAPVRRGLHRGGAGIRGATVDGADQRHDGPGGSDHRDLRHGGAARQVRPGLPALGPAVLPAVQRARCRFRPGRGGDKRRAHEWGMAARRAEGLVVRGPVRRLRPAAGPDRPGGRQAGRADDVPHPDGRGRGGGPAHPADERGLLVQRGLPVRRAGR